MTEGPVKKVIAVVDLSRYSDISLARQDQEGPGGVQALNREIQGLIGQALSAAGVDPEATPIKPTGDGAILALDRAETASRFGAELHRLAAVHNLDKATELARRHFRVGIWTDDVVLTQQATSNGEAYGFDFAGTAISNAVRLEGACGTGEILIGPEVWADLPAAERRFYGEQEEVAGKRKERFRAHRRRMVEAAPWEVPSPTAISSRGAPAPDRTVGEATGHAWYSGAVRDRVCRRLLGDWRRLANVLEVPPADQDRFARGQPADDLWDWLAVRDRLEELEAALRAIERADLAEELARDGPR